MFFNKIFHFVKGYVIIKVTGFYIERFLYICAKRGIRFLSIGNIENNSLFVCVGIKDFKKLRPVLKKTNTRLRIVKKCGLPFFVARIRKRYFLTVGISAIILLMAISSQFIWTIEIVGDDIDIAKDISRALDEANLHIGSFKPSLIEGEKMKSIIMKNTDNLVWAWVYINGTRASVEYKEGIRAPEVVDKSEPCDIVAIRDGVITQIIEKNGKKRATAGDTVMKGDLLIAGTLETTSGEMKTVHAIGDVYANTWHEKSTDVKLYNDNYVPTGREKSYITVKLFSKCFDLFRNDNPDFSEYLISEKLSELKLGENNYLGIGLYKKTYSEVKTQKLPIKYDLAVEKGRNILEEQIAKELLPKSRLIEKTVEHEQIDDETVRVTVRMQFVEKIGTQVKINVNNEILEQ